MDTWKTDISAKQLILDQFSILWISLQKYSGTNDIYWLWKGFWQRRMGFLLYCLKSFNFGLNFIHWVQTFYRKIQSCVINNGLSSEYFNLEREVRQGAPLSPYLFVVTVTIETLAIPIPQNKNIKGISIGNEETKIL